MTTLVLLVSLLSLQTLDGEQPLERIAFGSCAHQDKPQPIWKAIIQTKPQLFLFTGDNIYGDSANVDVMRAKYAQLAAKPGYQKMLQTAPILSVWDDHDYGLNDGGAEFKGRQETEKLFLDFFKIPADSERRSRPGIYGSSFFGPPGRRLQIILLDTRYFRSRGVKSNIPRDQRPAGQGPYLGNKNPEATVLGPDQWTWLEQQLKLPAQIRLIVSSTQVVAYEHWWESWGLFPLQRQAMFDLIQKTGAEGVFFISGDVHRAELSCRKGEPYPLYDLTSSGLTESWDGTDALSNRFRVKDHLYSRNNFGQIRIDWQQAVPKIHLSIHDETGAQVFGHHISLDELK